MKVPGLLPAGSILLIVVSLLTWYFQLAGGAFVCAMQALPLLLTLPGQYRNERRARQWLGFILLFMLLVSVTRAFNGPPILRMLGALNLVLTIAMFGWLLYSMKSAPQPKASANTES